MDPSKNFPPKLFSDETEPKSERSINYSSNFKFLPMVAERVGPEVWEHIKKSPLGIICKFEELKFTVSTRLVHFILCKQLICKKPYELWFLIAGQPAHFSFFEFEEITGLNYDEFPDSPVEVDEEESSCFWGLFNLSPHRTTPYTEDIVQICTGASGCSSWSREDKIRLSYLAILTNGLLDLDRREAIPPARAKLVMDLELFKTYPWGRLAFEDLVKQVKLINEKRIHQHSYVCKGFMQVLQIWAYHCIPHLGESIGHPITSRGPPLLRFKGKNGKLGLDNFFSNNKITVTSMCERSRTELRPYWSNNDEYHDAIENLLNYIADGKDLTCITWRALPEWPLPKSNGAKRKPDPLADEDKPSGKKVAKSRNKIVKKYVDAEGDDDCDLRALVLSLNSRVASLEDERSRADQIEDGVFSGTNIRALVDRVSLLEDGVFSGTNIQALVDRVSVLEDGVFFWH